MDAPEIAEEFNARARRYANDDWHRRFAEQLVDVTPLLPGHRVLDAATGTGFAACAIAHRVGPAGRVLGVDVSPGMLVQARRSVEAARLTNVDLLEADATDLHDLPASTFDAVVCSAGLHYMPVAKALSAWHRLLRPDGVLAFSTRMAGSPLTGRIFKACAATFGWDVKDRIEPLGTEERCLTVLAQAGFDCVQVIAAQVKFETFDPELAWDANLRSAGFATAPPLDRDQREALKQHYFNALADALRADPAACAGTDVLFAIGHRPESRSA